MKRKPVLLTLAVFVVTFGVYQWFFKAPPTLEAQARTAMESMVSGDARTISQMATSDEAKTGWTAENDQRIYHDVINPFWKNLPKVGGIRTQEFTGQAVAIQSYRLPNGIVFPRVVSLYAEDEHGTLSVGDDLQQTFYAMVVAKEGEHAKGYAMELGVVRGLEQHRDYLKGLGITALAYRDPSHGVLREVPFDEAVRNAQMKIDRAKRN